MNTLRAFARTSKMGTFMVARRTGIHQTNEGDDLTWLEAKFDLSNEDKTLYSRQWVLLKGQAAHINKKYEDEHKTTRQHLKEHREKSHQKFASLEAKIDNLKQLIVQKTTALQVVANKNDKKE